MRVVPDRWRAGSGGASGGGGCDGAWVAAAGAEVATARGGAADSGCVRRDPLGAFALASGSQQARDKPAAPCSGCEIPAASKRRLWLGVTRWDPVIALRST